MKSSLLSRSVVGLALGLSCLSAQAADSAFSSSTNLTFTSDYMFRGVSQTSSTPAIQGGMTVSHSSGLYAGIWGSSVSFANMELDPSLGFSRAVGDLTYDVGVVRYGYPGYSSAAQGGLPFTEAYGSIAFKGAKLGAAWSDNYFGGNGKEIYTYLSYGTEIKGVSLSASVGQTSFGRYTFGPDASDSYVDYSLTVGKAFAGLNFAVSVAGSDMDKDDCASFSGDANSCSARAIASVSKSL